MKTSLIIIIIIILSSIPVKKVFSQTPFYYVEPVKVDTQRIPFRKAGIPLITDLDKDGQKEIIFFVLDYNGAASPVGMLYVINSAGKNYPGFPKGFNDYALDVASGDVDGDGYLDIALRFTSSFDVIDRFGNHLSGFPVYYSDGNIDPVKFISLYDLDNDGKLEIIVSKKNEVCVFNFNGTIREGWPRYVPGSAIYNPAIGDIDGDGIAEIIINSFKFENSIIDSGMVHIFRQDGSPYSVNWPKYLDSSYYSWSSSPSLFINKNNYSLSYFTVVSDKFSTSGSDIHKFTKFDLSANILNLRYYEAVMDYGTLVMGDIDRDNNLDFVSGTQYGNTLSAFKNNLTAIDGWPQWGVGEHEATAEIGKVNYGNELNIINNRWSADNGYGYIQAYTKDGINLPWSPLRPIGLVKSISFTDLNNDGSVELISTSATYSDTYLNIWTIPGIPFTADNFPWPQYGHDRYRSNQYGFIPPDEPVGIKPISTIVPDKFTLMQNYPNPFNPVTHLGFAVPSNVKGQMSNVKLIVFDALGREVATLVNEKLSQGSYQVTFDGSDLSSGVYFYTLSVGEFRETKRMMLLK